MKARKLFEYSNSRLRRGRRLYGRICAKQINKTPDIVHHLAAKAISRGLYSQLTGEQNVKFSLCRYAYMHSQHYDRKGGFGWYAWIESFGAVWFQKPKYKNGKLLIKLIN